MRNTIVILTLLLCLVMSGCAKLGDVSVKANGTSPGNKAAKFDNPSSDFSLSDSQTNSNRQKYDDKTKLTKVDSESPLIWYGEIDDQDLESVGETVKYSNYGLLSENQLDQIGKAFEVDVLNCGGYLYSAVISNRYDGELKEERWEYRILPDSVAIDAKTKIAQCSNSRKDTSNNFVSSNALAIAPSNQKRKNIKTGKVDTRKLFASLPKDVRQWLDQDLRMPGQTASLDGLEREEKTNLSIKNGDDWIDIDGDRKIDFVNVSGVDKDFLYGKGQNYSYNRIFLRHKDNWKEIDISDIPD